MKKIISLILVITMVLSSISSAFAYFWVDKDKCRYMRYFHNAYGSGVGYGDCEDKDITESFPETMEACEESQECVVYKGGKLKFKDNILFIPKEKTEEALRQVGKLIDKEDITKAILVAGSLGLLSMSPYACMIAKSLKEIKKLEDEFGLTDLKKELKEAKVELRKKRKRHEDCSKLQNKVEELKNKLNEKCREFNSKYSGFIDLKFVKSLVLGMIAAFGITNMWIAVFGDVGVAVLAILNAMRVNSKY